jgi:hypothetical protein
MHPSFLVYRQPNRRLVIVNARDDLGCNDTGNQSAGMRICMGFFCSISTLYQAALISTKLNFWFTLLSENDELFQLLCTFSEDEPIR